MYRFQHILFFSHIIFKNTSLKSQVSEEAAKRMKSAENEAKIQKEKATREHDLQIERIQEEANAELEKAEAILKEAQGLGR